MTQIGFEKGTRMTNINVMDTGGEKLSVQVIHGRQDGPTVFVSAAVHGDEIIGVKPEEPGQDKPIKQDIGKNMMYHSFDFTQPDLVAPGHIVNLPALCGGLYPNYCGEDYDGTNPTCTCTPGSARFCSSMVNAVVWSTADLIRTGSKTVF